MILREYRQSDANEILGWIHNEREFRLWSADRYGGYPIDSDDINNNYLKCMELSGFYPLTLEDDGKIIGHLILRNHPGDNSMLRLGFIIVDSSIRGKGYGRKLIEEAIRYAKEKFNIENFSLGVFTNNENAFNCYQRLGFNIIDIINNAYQFYDENWDCAEMVLKKIR